MDIDSAYLDYYNLDVTDENAVEQFVMCYDIKEPQLLSGGEILTIEKLRGQHHCLYRQVFDFFTKHTANEIMNIIDEELAPMRGNAISFYGFPSHVLLQIAQDHVNRTKPAWKGVPTTGGYRWGIFWCADFLALVYLQLWLSVNGKERYAVCPQCGKNFATTKATKKYCDETCKKRAADARYRARQKEASKK